MPAIAVKMFISKISKQDAIKATQNIAKPKKSRTLSNIKIYYHISKWVKKF